MHLTSTRGYNDASSCVFYNFSSSGGWTDRQTDLLGRFKTLSLWLLTWFYYSLWREICIFDTFYKSVTVGPTDGRTNGWMDTASYRDARTHLKTWEIAITMRMVANDTKLCQHYLWQWEAPMNKVWHIGMSKISVYSSDFGTQLWINFEGL